MKNKETSIYIGIDNGVSGSIGIITNKEIKYYHSPIKKELNYTKTKKWFNRIDIPKFSGLLEQYNLNEDDKTIVYIERPMVNPGRFQATVSALRALEATLIILESLELPYQYIDSKEWQKKLLPSGLKGKELKEASLQIGKRLFPHIDFKEFDDADGLLIAEYCKRQYKKGD
jgi:hypothetical protein